MLEVFTEAKVCDLNQIKHLSGKERAIVKEIMHALSKGSAEVELQDKKLVGADIDNLVVHLRNRNIQKQPSNFIVRFFKGIMNRYFGRVAATSVFKEIDKAKKAQIALKTFGFKAEGIIGEIKEAIKPATIDVSASNFAPKTPAEAKKLFKEMANKIHADKIARMGGVDQEHAKDMWDRFDRAYIALCKQLCTSLDIKYEDDQDAKNEIDRVVALG